MTRSLMRPRRGQGGFTLAEILVACTLLSIVMSGLYFAFSSSIRMWRLGEANLRTYQDARTSLRIMTRELQCIPRDAAHLCEGKDDEFEFFALVPPMDVELGEESRIMWVKYRLKESPSGESGKLLVREERVVDGALPLPEDEQGDTSATRLDLGRKKTFELAAGVEDFELAYCWVPVLPPGEPPPVGEDLEEGTPPDPIWLDEHNENDGMPQAIAIALTLQDPNAEEGETLFEQLVAFRGPTAQRVLDPSLQMKEGL